MGLSIMPRWVPLLLLSMLLWVVVMLLLLLYMLRLVVVLLLLLRMLLLMVLLLLGSVLLLLSGLSAHTRHVWIRALLSLCRLLLLLVGGSYRGLLLTV